MILLYNFVIRAKTTTENFFFGYSPTTPLQFNIQFGHRFSIRLSI